MWNVQVISTDTVKPSTPTPPHRRSYKLSLLDQLAPSFYVPLIVFYSSNNGTGNSERVQQLKNSLSETLTRYYPLAGRIKEGIVDCNDDGVDFVEARVSGELSEFLEELNLDVLEQLVPCHFQSAKSGKDVLFAVQANTFDCGGMAIGLEISHEIADGTSLITLMNSWAATSRGANEFIGPSFGSASFFPPAASVPRFVFPTVTNISIRRFVFDSSKIAKLKAGLTKDSHLRQPTTVEAVSALIWQTVIRVQRDRGYAGAYAAMHAVSLRKRMDPPLPDDSFGNIWLPIFTTGIMEGECSEEDMQRCLVSQLKDAIGKVDANFVKELLGPCAIRKAYEPLQVLAEKYSNSGIRFCNFTSWSRFPIYEVDFGWGKPIWASISKIPVNNFVALLETRNGEGIEAWVCIEEEAMAKFEQDQELLSFVSSPTISQVV